jgi:lysophospholipase L1-like esterase
MVVPPPACVDDDPYPGLLDEALLARGVVARTTLGARWHATVKEVLRRLEEWVRDPLPDVVVVNVGVVDCQARVVPTWLYRHVVTWLPGTSAWSARYRRHAVPVLRRGVRGWQRRTVGRVPLLLSRVPPGTFRRAVELLVRRAVRDHRALVLVLDVDGPGPALLGLQPGITARIAAYNDVLRSLVADLDDERVVLLSTSELVMPDQERLLPDGLHRSAEGHRLVAAALADAIVARQHLLRRTAASLR